MPTNQNMAVSSRKSIPAASIWFEIWGVVDPSQQNFDFSRQIFEKFRFIQASFQKVLIFSGNLKTISIFQAKIAHLQLLLGKVFYFSSKVTTFEFTSCRVYIIR